MRRRRTFSRTPSEIASGQADLFSNLSRRAASTFALAVRQDRPLEPAQASPPAPARARSLGQQHRQPAAPASPGISPRLPSYSYRTASPAADPATNTDVPRR